LLFPTLSANLFGAIDMDIFHRVNDDIYVFKTGLHKAKLALQVNGITIGVHTRYSLNYEYGLPLGPTLSNPNGPSIEFTDNVVRNWYNDAIQTRLESRGKQLDLALERVNELVKDISYLNSLRPLEIS